MSYIIIHKLKRKKDIPVSLALFVFKQVKDQQEAEKKKVTSQEIQQALEAQTKVITEKQKAVREDLAQVEPAVIEAQQGKLI